MSLSFPIPDWDGNAFFYPNAIISEALGEDVSFKKKNESGKRKREANGATKKKEWQGNLKTPTKRIAGGKESSDSVGRGSKDDPKEKKKKGLKKKTDHALEDKDPDKEKDCNTTKLHIITHKKSLLKKIKKSRNNNKYKDLNIKQKAEKLLSQNSGTNNKDSLSSTVRLEQQETGITVAQDKKSRRERQLLSPPEKKVRKKKKIHLPECSLTEEINTNDKNNKDNNTINEHSKEINAAKKNNSLIISQPNINQNTNHIQDKKGSLNFNDSPNANMKKNRKNKAFSKSLVPPPALLNIKKKYIFKDEATAQGNIKLKKVTQSSQHSEKSGSIANNDGQVKAVAMMKKGKRETFETPKKKKEKKKKNGVPFKEKDSNISHKTELKSVKNGIKSVEMEDSEVEDLVFDGEEECSEEFNKDFNNLLSNLNFYRFKSTKKSKKKRSKESENVNSEDTPQKTKEVKFTNEECKSKSSDDGNATKNTECNKGKKRKRNSLKTNSEVSTKPKKYKLEDSHSESAEKPKTPIKKAVVTKFNREKVAKLLEEAENITKEKEKQLSSGPPSDQGSGSLRKRMEDRLLAARFRLVNQDLYTKSSTEAKHLFKKDPQAFYIYHQGFQAQVHQWPVNPLDLIIAWLSKKPKEWVVADMGCGEAALAQKVPQSLVHSLDLVAANDRVTACDMAHTPLLAASVDVVVFCLSLMGTNLKDFISEANRILRVGGIMKIAEVESRCGDLKEFEKLFSKYGFHCTGRDTTHQYFFLLEFKKHCKLKMSVLPDLHLKPCYYKKR